jgi:hypothetical protein
LGCVPDSPYHFDSVLFTSPPLCSVFIQCVNCFTRQYEQRSSGTKPLCIIESPVLQVNSEFYKFWSLTCSCE